MAAAETGREMYYFAHGDKEISSQLTEMHNYLQNNTLCVSEYCTINSSIRFHLQMIIKGIERIFAGDLWRLIIEYEQVRHKSKSCGDLFSWVTNNGKRSAKLPVANSNRTHTDYNIPGNLS